MGVRLWETDSRSYILVSTQLQREALGSAGTGSGVAIPHARLPNMPRPFVAIRALRLREMTKFDLLSLGWRIAGI
jgi:mannitol/fructose-specific phosphotransferase system IIA component (Ntr-type)